MKNFEIRPGLTGLLNFCEYLTDVNVTYSIHKYSDDALTVFFTVVGARVEVQFFENDWNFSYFKGDEGVIDSEKKIKEIINKFIG